MIIITGASGGIGRRLVQALAPVETVVGTYFKHQPEASGAAARFFQVDVADPESITHFVHGLHDQLSKVTLVNLAGVSISRLALQLKPAEWDEVLDVNLKGSFLMSKALLPFMVQERWGRIINVSSVVADTGMSGASAYAASKAGLVGLTKTLAQEYGRYDITVNCLALGYFSEGLIEAVPADVKTALLARIPLGHFGDIQDVATAIRYLMSANYTTGSIIHINGGLL